MPIIIIHEMTHLKIEGHSHNFWNLFHKYIPDYAERINWLKINGKILI